MSATTPFAPGRSTGQTVTPGASASFNIDRNALQVCLTNLGTAVAYVSTWNSANPAVTATAADYPVPAGQQVIISKSDGHDRIAVFGTGGSLHVMTGAGM